MEPFLFISPGLIQLGYLAGTVFALIDLAQRDIGAKVWWIIAILFFPFAWVIFLFMARNIPKTTDQFAHTQSSTPTVFPESADQGPVQEEQNPIGTASANAAAAPAAQRSRTGGAIKTVGMVLGIIALVSGVIIVGLFILLMLAISSYGSNK